MEKQCVFSAIQNIGNVKGKDMVTLAVIGYRRMQNSGSVKTFAVEETFDDSACDVKTRVFDFSCKIKDLAETKSVS